MYVRGAHGAYHIIEWRQSFASISWWHRATSVFPIVFKMIIAVPCHVCAIPSRIVAIRTALGHCHRCPLICCHRISVILGLVRLHHDWIECFALRAASWRWMDGAAQCYAKWIDPHLFGKNNDQLVDLFGCISTSTWKLSMTTLIALTKLRFEEIQSTKSKGFHWSMEKEGN